MDSQSYSAADEEEHVEPAVVYQEEGVKCYFYDCMTFPHPRHESCPAIHLQLAS